MADLRKLISDLPANTSLNGTELFELQKGSTTGASQSVLLSALVAYILGQYTSVLDITAGSNITVDSTDPEHPIVSGEPAGVQTIVAGSNVTIDNTDPENPIISSSGGGGGSSGGQALLTSAILALSPKVYYKCDETSGSILADSSGNGQNLTLRGSNTLGYGELVDGGSSFWTDAGATNGANRADSGGIVVPTNYDWSYVAIISPESTNTSGTIYLLTLIVSGESEVTNAQFDIYLTYTSSQLRVVLLWEYSSGTNMESDGCLVPNGQPFMLGIRKNTASKTVDWFINGRRVYITAYSNEPTGGTSCILGLHTEAGLTSTQGISSSNHAWFDSALADSDFKAIAKAAGYY